MIIRKKKELQKPPRILPGLTVLGLSSYLLLGFPCYSNADQGVNSNTITNSSTTSVTTGNPTSETVVNEDYSETTTITTPITTTTTTVTVTQTETDNVVKNPNFTNHLGGGSSTDWNIIACGGAGCAFSPNDGFRTSYGTGTISQSGTLEDLVTNYDISLEEAGQGMTFEFGANVNNTFKNQIGGNYTQGGTTDTWSINLEVFDANNQSLGSETIGVTGGANIGNQYQTNQVETGTLNINSGNYAYSGTITLSGVDNGYWGGYYGPRFQNVFTTLLYNEIETEISQATTYETLVTTVDCEILDTCPFNITETTLELISDITTNDIQTEPELLAEPVIETANLEITPVSTTPQPQGMTIQTDLTIETPVETNIEIEVDVEVAEVEIEIVEVESNIEAEIQNETEENKTEVTETEKQEEPEIKDVTNVENKSESNETTKNESQTEKKTSEPKKQPKKITKESKEKAGQKIVNKMGDKGRYSGGNQLKTLVVMNVIGNTRDFFQTQKIIPDTPNFFTDSKIPDNSITDNNFASYFMFGGSDAAHNELIESQYK